MQILLSWFLVKMHLTTYLSFFHFSLTRPCPCPCPHWTFIAKGSESKNATSNQTKFEKHISLCFWFWMKYSCFFFVSCFLFHSFLHWVQSNISKIKHFKYSPSACSYLQIWHPTQRRLLLPTNALEKERRVWQWDKVTCLSLSRSSIHICLEHPWYSSTTIPTWVFPQIYTGQTYLTYLFIV